MALEEDKEEIFKITEAFASQTIAREMALCRIEEMVCHIKEAIISASTELPFIPMIEWNIEKLSAFHDISYIVRLFHECWCIYNPYYKTNNVISVDDDIEAMDRGLSHYSDGGEGFDLKNEMDRDVVSAYINRQRPEAMQNNPGIDLIYNGYFQKIHRALSMKIKASGNTLLPEFVIDYGIPIGVNISKKQKSDLADYLVRNGYIKDGDKQALFLSLGSNITASGDNVHWIHKHNKSKSMNYASLYHLFKTLGANMNADTRKKISEVFRYGEDGEIDYVKLKSRELSPGLESFIRDIKAIVTPK